MNFTQQLSRMNERIDGVAKAFTDALKRRDEITLKAVRDLEAQVVELQAKVAKLEEPRP